MSSTFSNTNKVLSLGMFVKFGIGGVFHHHCDMPNNYLLVGITILMFKGVHLPCPKSQHDPPLHVVDDAVGYMVLGPWK
jgi:hypothetical protein